MLVEILTSTKQSSPTAIVMLKALVNAAQAYGDSVIEPSAYVGLGEWLVLYGVGAADRNLWRQQHVKSGRRAILWDLGYFGREKLTGHLRVSVNRDHPQAWLDVTPVKTDRWEALGIPLRECYNPIGPVILVGLGRKSREYLKAQHWEEEKFKELQARYPGRRIIYRPKPGHPAPKLHGVDGDDTTPIEELLEGASLVVCRHSNVAVDGIVAGIPFEAEDGAAMWLADKPFTRENRLSFLWRLAYWQWRASEATQAWQFLRRIVH